MEWSSKQEFLESIEEDSGITPKALLNKPVIDSVTKPFFDGFRLLHRSRQVTLGVGPITIADIASYVALYPQQDLDLFIQVILSVDDQYINRQNQKKSKSLPQDIVPYAQKGNARN